MRRRFLSLSSSLLLVTFFSSPASASDLMLGKAQNGVLHDGKGPTYSLSLQAGDYVQADLDLHDTDLVITVADPSGAISRRFRLDPDYGNQIRFVAEAAGTYRLEVNGAENSKQGTFSITLSRVVSLDARLAPEPPPEPYESAEIKQLKTNVSAGKQDAVAHFWKVAAAARTPLLEAIDGDKKYMLATFLWKGNETTRNVEVLWFPYTRAWPDDYRMIHAAGTNVWYKTLKVNRQSRFVYRLTPNASYLRTTQERDWLQFRMFMAGSQTDPLNPRHWMHDPYNPDPVEFQDWSVVELPDAPPQPWNEPRLGVPTGTLEHHQFKSAILNNERELGVYLPPGYRPSAKTRQPYSLLVLFDEGAYVETKSGQAWIPMVRIIDNLIAEERIPPVVVLLIDNPPGLRNVELDCNPAFFDSLISEMIPWVREHYNVTRDPKNTVAGGLSLGGLAAAFAAFHHPEIFGNVLSQSGGFSRTPSGGNFSAPFNPDVEPNWMAKQFVESPRLPLRFYLTVGRDEFDPSGRGEGLLESNRHIRDVLLAKGYEVYYNEYYGGHDFLSWRGSLADGLIALLGADRSPTY